MPADPPPPPTCAVCGQVIGVYEPMIAAREDDEPLETSIAAEPELEQRPGARYHRACYGSDAAR